MATDNDSRDTVRLTWWSASGMEEREIPFESIQSIDLNPTSGSKNPFSVSVKGECFEQYCRSIEWPENRCLPSDTEQGDSDV